MGICQWTGILMSYNYVDYDVDYVVVVVVVVVDDDDDDDDDDDASYNSSNTF